MAVWLKLFGQAVLKTSSRSGNTTLLWSSSVCVICNAGRILPVFRLVDFLCEPPTASCRCCLSWLGGLTCVGRCLMNKSYADADCLAKHSRTFCSWMTVDPFVTQSREGILFRFLVFLRWSLFQSKVLDNNPFATFLAPTKLWWLFSTEKRRKCKNEFSFRSHTALEPGGTLEE